MIRFIRMSSSPKYVHCLILLSSVLTRLPFPTSGPTLQNYLCSTSVLSNHVDYTSSMMSPLVCLQGWKTHNYIPEEEGLRVGELHLCHTFQNVMHPSGDLMISVVLGVGKQIPPDVCDLGTGMLISLPESDITTAALTSKSVPSSLCALIFLFSFSMHIPGPLSPMIAL